MKENQESHSTQIKLADFKAITGIDVKTLAKAMGYSQPALAKMLRLKKDIDVLLWDDGRVALREIKPLRSGQL